MRPYEAVFIFRPEEEEFAEGKSFVKSQLEGAGMSIVKEEDMKRRELAYEIKKEKSGHYYLFEVESEPDALRAVERSLLLKPEILKYLVVRKS